MKNPIIIVAAVVVIAVLGLGAFKFSQNSSNTDTMMKKDETSTESTEAMMKKDTVVSEDEKMMADKVEGSRYVEYSKAALDGASGNRRVLFFYASWCPTCKPTDANFTQNVSKIPEDVTLIRVNYEDPETDQEEKDLAKKYGITYQHTFVQIDGDGREVTKWNGGQINELLSKIK